MPDQETPKPAQPSHPDYVGPVANDRQLAPVGSTAEQQAARATQQVAMKQALDQQAAEAAKYAARQAELNRIPRTGTPQERIMGAMANNARAIDLVPLIRQIPDAEYAQFYVENSTKVSRYFGAQNEGVTFTNAHAQHLKGDAGENVRKEILARQASARATAKAAAALVAAPSPQPDVSPIYQIQENPAIAEIKQLLNSYDGLTPQQALMTDDVLMEKMAKLEPWESKQLLHSDERAASLFASRVAANPHVEYAPLVAEMSPPAAAPKAPSRLTTGAAATGAGAGAGMAAYSLIANSQAIGEDWDAGGQRAFATSGRVTADVANIGLGVATTVRPTQFASLGLKVGLPLAVASGAFEGYAAAQAGDRERAARAFGGTTGGIVAGVGVGALAGLETGPGAILTGIAGGVVGAFVGAEAMEKYGQGITGYMLGIDGDIRRMISDATPNMRKTLGVEFKGNYENRDSISDADVEKVYAYIKESGIRGVSEIDTDKNGLEGLDLLNLITENNKLKQALPTLDPTFTKYFDSNKDNKLDLAEIRSAVKFHNVNTYALDANGDRTVSGEELGLAILVAAEKKNAAELPQRLTEAKRKESAQINLQTIGKYTPEEQKALAWYIVNSGNPSGYKDPNAPEVKALEDKFRNYDVEAAKPTAQNVTIPMLDVMKGIYEKSITMHDAVTAYNAAKGRPAGEISSFDALKQSVVVTPPVQAPQVGKPVVEAPVTGKPEAETPVAGKPEAGKPVTAKPDAPIPPAPTEKSETTHTVGAGDTLSSILSSNAQYKDVPNHAFGYVALKLAIEKANAGKAIFLENSLELRADAGDIKLPTAEEVKTAFQKSDMKYDDVVGKIRGQYADDVLPPNYTGPVASQKSLENKGMLFK